MTDHRIGLDLFTDILDVLHRHGFARGDIEHQGRAISLIRDLARTYEGTQDRPFRPSIAPAPVPQMGPEPSGQDRRDAVIVPASELKTVLAARGYRRRLQAPPRRDVHRLPRPVLPRLPDPPPRRPGLRPDGRPDAPGR